MSYNYDENDPLNPAKGMVNGFLIVIPFWAIVGIILYYIFN